MKLIIELNDVRIPCEDRREGRRGMDRVLWVQKNETTSKTNHNPSQHSSDRPVWQSVQSMSSIKRELTIEHHI